ncbi:integrin beta-8 isoform X1 [Electrophorus electricus]|uniref:integrin beta-8 isoform X1 n=1 Tax=Electrophorus electricus TaxID=8005 RepID=UPI0015D012CD|nr:integrin beta-8 isoform X1 [Electrophorus electricus]
MTSWLRKYHNIILRSVLAITVVALGSSHSSDKHCTLPLAATCEECLLRGPECAWCFQERFLDGAGVSERCDSVARLLRKGCGEEFIDNPRVKVEVNASPSSSQVAPRDISILLRPGSEASFLVEVQQLEQYPVDLYYLVDVSASMQDNLDRLKTVGMTLSQRMKEHSSDFRVGFGSFVDKPVSPYINVHPSKIINPCSDYEVNCRPAHGFIHVLPVTENMVEFKRVIQHQRIAGNMDTPEGGFDAMLQAAVCQDIGWRPEAKHLLLVMTDQPSHLALDSKLAGIVVPHDGRCHLVGNTYSQSANMEHPTIGQLAEKLLENSIYSIFAVDQMQYKWYEDLVDFLPGTYLGKLLPKALNLTDLVVDAYKKLLSDVGVEVGVEDSEAHRFWVNITALCPNGSTVTGNSKCSNVQPSQKVLFNVTVGMRACPSGRPVGGATAEVTALVRPVGFNETVRVRLRQACACSCSRAGSCHNEPEPPSCAPETDSCREEAGGALCSGRGTCVCGVCVCDRSNLGTIYGKHCERDDFSCPYDRGLVCGGHGQCVSGRCLCRPGWTGEGCSCPSSTDSCASPDGLVCSGMGECVCGQCVCGDHRRSGRFCEKCPTCSNTCQSQWSCVDCHLSGGFDRAGARRCNASCTALVAFVDDITELIRGKYCLYQSQEHCFVRFHVQLGSQGPHLRISRHVECVSGRRYFQTFLSVFLLTVVLGLGILAVARLILRGGGRPWNVKVSQGFNDNSKVCTPSTSEKTITYRRDHLPENPMEMHVHGPKTALNEMWP